MTNKINKNVILNKIQPITHQDFIKKIIIIKTINYKFKTSAIR